MPSASTLPHIVAFLMCAFFIQRHHAWAFRNKFDEMKLSQFFIDKTEFLRLLFDPVMTSSQEQFYFVTAPHRFSKSTLLRMTQSFSEVELDFEGNVKPWPETYAYKIFKDTKIGQYPELVEKHLARYPVIFLDLTKYAAMHQSHRKIAIELNQKYLEALKPFTTRTSRMQKYIRDGYPDNFTMSISSRRFIETIYARNLTIQTLDSSLLLLVKFMYELFDNTPVILLIDEYDNTALRSYIFQRGYTARNYRKLNHILSKLIKGGKNYLKNVLMMGVSSLAFASDDLLPKFMTHMCFLNDHAFMPYMGITQTDIIEVFDKYGCSEEEKTAVLEFYKPYRTAIKKAPMYHPFSLSSYFSFRTLPNYQDSLQTYWRKIEGQGLNAPFYRSKVFRKTIDDLLSNKTVRLKLRKQQPGDALDQLELLRDVNFGRISDEQVFLFIRLYFELGYFSHGEGDMHAYIIPNIDAKQIIEYDLEVYWARYAKYDTNVTTTTTTTTVATTRNEFVNHENNNNNNKDADPNIVMAADSGISLVDEEPSDPEAVPGFADVESATPTEHSDTMNVSPPEPEQPVTYDLRSRY